MGGMRGATVLVLALAVLAGCGGTRAADQERRAPAREAPRVLAERQVAPRVLELTVRSPAVGADVRVRLLTPRGWARGTGRRWPVLLLLHGCCDDPASWTERTDVEGVRGLRDVLVVMPEGGDVGFYSDWHNGGAGGRPAWEAFHLGELRALLERDFGAGPRRAVAGLSMGGLGAMGYAARRPGLFGAAASFSGLLAPLRDAGLILGLVGAFAGDAQALWGDPRRDRGVWEQHDPTELAGRLRGTALFVAAGDGRPGPLDPRGASRDPIEGLTFRQSRAFAARLRALGIAARTDFYGAGRHAWPYWERGLRRALPVLRQAWR